MPDIAVRRKGEGGREKGWGEVNFCALSSNF